MSANTKALPRIVSEAEWQSAREALLVEEKKLTRAHDALAAKRRLLPMTRVEKSYIFDDRSGKVSLLDLFEGRPQLLLYHFMFAPGVDGWPAAGCPGCSMTLDEIGHFAPVHIGARGVSFAVVSRAPFPNIEAYRKRMRWNWRWVSSADNTFNVDFGLTTPDEEKHGYSVFLRSGNDIFRTYFTSQRGTEGLGGTWSFLDLVPYGRQEEWEESPEGWPQSPPYQWWRRHDEY
jgi:predicted dithiol-disulfide oxidoreductase (DUF899 family)